MGSSLLDEPSGDELLGNLDGVEGGAFADLVADHPDVESGGHGAVLADAADEDFVAAGGEGWHGVDLAVGLVEDDDAGGFGQDAPRFVDPTLRGFRGL
jgi:hypothetical protein